MTRPRPFTQLDVFSRDPLLGNPLAVVHDADDLTDVQMRAFARWTNLSETTFLLAPGDAAADYRVRIFTPGGELKFAGHPTLGSCQAWLARGGTPKRTARVVQECGVGLVHIRREGARLSFAAPPLAQADVPAELMVRVTRALGIAPDAVRRAALLDNGTTWLALLLRDAELVRALQPDHTALKMLEKVGVVGMCGAAEECLVELRAFASVVGITEDPVTGSLNASVAQWLMEAGELPESYIAAQGSRMGRAGRVYVERLAGSVWVGGDVAACISGTVTF